MLKTITLIAVLFLISCENEEKGIKVQTEKISLNNITEKVEGVGKVKPEKDVKISSDVAGRIINIYGRPGDKIKAGQVLAKIDPKNYQAAVARAKSNLISSQANLLKAKRSLDRSKELKKQSLISEAEIEIVEADYKVQLAQVQQSRAGLKEANQNLEKCTVVSPIDGVMTVKNKEDGEIAQGSSFNLDILMEIADLSRMETVIEVSETEIVKIKIGQECELEVDAFPGKTFTGVVTEIANSATANQTSTTTNFEVKISINEAAAFRPGMNVTAYVSTSFVENAIVVPIQAITARKPKEITSPKTLESDALDAQADKNADFKAKREIIKSEKELEEVVFVLVDNIVEQRSVVKGISDDNYYRIISGLNEGEEVVIGPFSALSVNLEDSSKVRVDNEWFEKRNKN